MHDSSFSRRRGSGLKFGWALGKQRLSLERSMTAIVTLYDDLNTWTKDVRNDAGIGDRKRLPSTIGSSKGDKLLMVVANNRADLYSLGHTHRLSGTGSTITQL